MSTQKEIIDNNILFFIQTRKLDNNIKNEIYNNYKNQHSETFTNYQYPTNCITPTEYIKKLQKKK